MSLGGPIDAGARDLWVTVEAFTPAATASRQPGGTWAPLISVAMARRDASADERIRADQPAAYQQTTWWARYMPDLDPDLLDVPKLRRIVYAGRQYDIKAAEVVGRRRGVKLLTLAGSAVPSP